MRGDDDRASSFVGPGASTGEENVLAVVNEASEASRSTMVGSTKVSARSCSLKVGMGAHRKSPSKAKRPAHLTEAWTLVTRSSCMSMVLRSMSLSAGIRREHIELSGADAQNQWPAIQSIYALIRKQQ
jgi:hypothetical protein